MRKWVADIFDLPAEMSSVSRLELLGTQRLRLENHGGISFFSPSCLKVVTDQGLLEMHGTNLCIKFLSPELIWVEGDFTELRRVEG